ncbi:MAG: DNA-processing protein DprA [Acetatifactor sp.]|nr:DNA-processing protein DprA [Acetatifactor sp.]
MGNSKMNQNMMDKNEIERARKYACWLYSVPGIGDKTMEKLLALCPDVEQIYRMGEKLWQKALTVRQLEQIRDFARETNPEALYQGLLKQNIRFVTRTDADYPKRLRDIPDPPYALFVKGKLPAEGPSVAVIGARECSEYGRFVASGIGKALGEGGVQVISGMARGIDGISQDAALEAGGISFGVLGSGVDVCYPESNRELYEKLCARGGILSAYPLGTEARARNFPPRNRIVSGLADALIVVEARHKSGTLITVDMALEQGKDVYVVPGRVTDRLSDGCNYLIKQGAGIFLSPEDFLRDLWEGWLGRNGENKGTGQAICSEISDAMALQMPESVTRLSPLHREVYGVLDLQPMSLEQIRGRLSEEQGLQQLMLVLMELCMEKAAVQVSTGYFARRSGEGKFDKIHIEQLH